mgnify:CR=1 FL=1
MRRNWAILLISLLLSCFLWALHVLSLDYSAFLQYRVTVTTDMVGYSPTAVADETLLVRGKAAGFYVLNAMGFRGDPMDLEISVEQSLLTKKEDGSFTLTNSEDETHTLTVTDNGRGFDPANHPGVDEGHFGLDGIRDRVSRFDGALEIESAPGRGATIRISMTA